VLPIIRSALAALCLLRLRGISPAAGAFVTSAVLSVMVGVLLWRLVHLARVLVAV
jgi:hypothetical protein